MRLDENNGLNDSEKASRSFNLKLVFVVIIGLAVVVFILQFRRAKSVVKELNASKVKTSMGHSTNPHSLGSQDDRRPNNQSPLGAPKRRATLIKGFKGRINLVPRGKFKASAQTINLGRGRNYSEVLDYVAVSSEYRERFDPSSIAGEKFRRIFVEKPEAKGMASEILVKNARTGMIGVVTGTLVVRFVDAEAFAERQRLIPEGYKEVRTFNGIATAIWSAPDAKSMEELEATNASVIADRRVKSSTIEILEHDDVSK